MVKQQTPADVQAYILKCLRKKYGTRAGHYNCDTLEIINDENLDLVLISIQTVHQ